MQINYKLTALIFFILAIALRASLCLSNPPDNAFDNHFEPVGLILQTGTIPAKDACWECFQPPVFYAVSALIGRLSFDLGAQRTRVKKILQLLCCLYGILTVGLVYLILNRFPLSDFAKIIGFGLVCFLPRHIYMSAMHTNDAMAYLFVAISLYMLIRAIERNFDLKSLILLSFIITITIFIKYNTLVVLPATLVVFIVAYFQADKVVRHKYALSGFLVLFIPLSLLTVSMFANIKNYGKPLPANYEIYKNPMAVQPCAEEGVNFFTFKPWESIERPILEPTKLNSFWTLIYSGMWFDTEPKFICFMDPYIPWWLQYFNWQKGRQWFPGSNFSMPKPVFIAGSVLITLGLFPLMLGCIGAVNFFKTVKMTWAEHNWRETAKLSIFPVVLISNAAGIIALATKLPVYSTMKASYFLVSLPAFAYFLSSGVMALEKHKIINWLIIFMFSCLMLVVLFHIFHIVSYLYLIPQY